MKRSDFLKATAGIGMSLVALKTAEGKTPDVVKFKDHKKVKLAIDIQSISGFQNGGKMLRPADIMRMYTETGMLIYDGYRGNAPIIIDASSTDLYDGKDQQHEDSKS